MKVKTEPATLFWKHCSVTLYGSAGGEMVDTISLHASWPPCLWCNPVSFKRHH